MEKFIDNGLIKTYADIYHLDRYKERICQMDGFGEKSYENLIASVERARTTTLAKVIYSLGIPKVGLSGAKLICREFGDDVERVPAADEEALAAIDGIGPVIAGSFVEYFRDAEKRERFERLLSELRLVKEEVSGEQDLKGKVFVVTGSLNHFANRNELKEQIEKRGGKVTGSVTGKTDYLINNDTASSSSKNKKARELGIPVISEEDFLKL